MNTPLADGGDPVMDKTVTLNAPAPGPFLGQSMNCRACHLVDEHKENGLGNRTYADFAIRSPIPDRGDGRKSTTRNSPALVNTSIARPEGLFLHFDAEFTDGKSLVKGGFTGRNFGWLPTEHGRRPSATSPKSSARIMAKTSSAPNSEEPTARFLPARIQQFLPISASRRNSGLMSPSPLTTRSSKQSLNSLTPT